MAKKAKRRGRPQEYEIPDELLSIPGVSAEELASIVLQAKPPRRWRYMEEAEQATREQEGEAATE